VGEWHESETPKSLAEPLANIEWAIGQMLAAMDEGRYRFEEVHVRADLSYLRGEARRARRAPTTPAETDRSAP
jgi:hypothetical protein